MLLQTNSYIVPADRRADHARLIRRFRQALNKLGCDQFEVYEQVGANWSPAGANGRYVQIMRFRDRQHQQAVQAAERNDPGSQQIIAEFCELINFPYQQQHGYFATGFYTSVLQAAPRQLEYQEPAAEEEVAEETEAEYAAEGEYDAGEEPLPESEDAVDEAEQGEYFPQDEQGEALDAEAIPQDTSEEPGIEEGSAQETDEPQALDEEAEAEPLVPSEAPEQVHGEPWRPTYPRAVAEFEHAPQESDSAEPPIPGSVLRSFLDSLTQEDLQADPSVANLPPALPHPNDAETAALDNGYSEESALGEFAESPAPGETPSPGSQDSVTPHTQVLDEAEMGLQFDEEQETAAEHHERSTANPSNGNGSRHHAPSNGTPVDHAGHGGGPGSNGNGAHASAQEDATLGDYSFLRKLENPADRSRTGK